MLVSLLHIYVMRNLKGDKVMKDYIYERVLEIANYIYETKATVRQAAKVFGVSKSTVHKDVTKRLQKIDKNLDDKVRNVLDYNKSERHYRGGEATRKKYLNM